MERLNGDEDSVERIITICNHHIHTAQVRVIKYYLMEALKGHEDVCNRIMLIWKYDCQIARQAQYTKELPQRVKGYWRNCYFWARSWYKKCCANE